MATMLAAALVSAVASPACGFHPQLTQLQDAPCCTANDTLETNLDYQSDRITLCHSLTGLTLMSMGKMVELSNNRSLIAG